MDELFYKRLNNFWDHVSRTKMKYRFLVGVSRNGRMIQSSVTVNFPEGTAVAVRFATEDRLKYFTDEVVDRIFEDIARLVYHYFPWCETINCKAKISKRTETYQWKINQIIDEESENEY